MMSKISIIIILFSIISIENVASQIDEFWKDEIKSPIDSLLSKMEIANNTINKGLSTLDSLFIEDKLSLADFQMVAKHLLVIKHPRGYETLLENCLKYEHKHFMNAREVMAGKVLIINMVISRSSIEEMRSLADFVFYSNYLDKNLTSEELEFVKSVLYYFRDEYYTKYRMMNLDSKKIENLRYIFKD